MSQSHLQLLGCSDVLSKGEHHELHPLPKVAIPPSVAGLFGRGELEGLILRKRKSQSHLQLLGCSDLGCRMFYYSGNPDKSQSHLQLLGCSDAESATEVYRLVESSQSHLQLLGCSDMEQYAEYAVAYKQKSQSHLQLLGCSDLWTIQTAADTCESRVAIPPSVAGLFGLDNSLVTNTSPARVAIPPSVAGLFGR